MAETPYMETEALLAVMNEDEVEALRLIDDMLPGERRTLVGHLNRLSMLADDRLRCPRCGKPTEPLSAVTVSNLTQQREWWHAECLDARRAQERAAVDQLSRLSPRP